jgi:hypothetical protein
LGLIANELLEKRLNKHGYWQSKLVPGLWKHDTRPIQFTLVVDNFGVKYTRKEDVEHLKSVIEQDYTVTADWIGNQYIGITLNWDYKRRQVHLSMPNYVKKSLQTTSSQHVNGYIEAKRNLEATRVVCASLQRKYTVGTGISHEKEK